MRYDRETAGALEEIAGLITRQVPEKRLCAFFAARLLEGDTQTAARLHLGDGLLAKAKAAAARYAEAYLGMIDAVQVKLVYTNADQAGQRLAAMQRLQADALAHAIGPARAA